MKKVINITLGGQVFAIEQAAFDALDIYIKAIKQSLSPSDDVKEIVDDIEMALSEKFIKYGRSEKMAITESDIVEAKKQMGAPTDFKVEEEPVTNDSSDDSQETETKKRLYRDTEDSVIAGVSSGIAQYFDIDPVIVRILFVISLFFNGLGLLAYIVLWLVVPVAKTTAEKYAMRGDNVTLKKITDRVKKNIDKVSDKKIVDPGTTWSRVRGVFDGLFKVLGVLIDAVKHIVRLVLGLTFVLGGALSIAGLTVAYLVVLLSDKVLLPTEAQTAVDIMTGNPVGISAMIASFIMMVIPLQAIIITGASLLAKRNFFSIGKTISLFVIWFIAIVIAFTTSALQLEQVVKVVGPLEINEGVYEINIDYGTEEVNKSIEVYKDYSYKSDVKNIDLSYKSLEGSLKSEIRQFSALRELNISGNNFTGLPAEIGQLQNLEVLNLSNNQFTGLPHELGNLQKLKVLDVSGNNISGFDLQVIRDRLGNEVQIIE